MAQLNPFSTGCPLWTQHGLNAMTPPSPPVPTTTAVPASFTDQFNTLIERACYLQFQGFNEENNVELAQIMQIIKGSDMTTQQHQQYQSSVNAMSAAAPYIIPSQQRPVQESSYPYDTLYPQQQQVAITEPPQPPASVMQDNAIFSCIQLEALKNQIFAFKLLSRQMPIPSHIMQAVLRPLPCSSMSTTFIMTPTPTPTTQQQHQLPPTPIEEMKPSSTMDASTIVASPPMSKSSFDERSTSSPPTTTTQQQSTTMYYNAYASPYNLFKTPISSFMHATSQHRQMVPSVLPVGVDPQQLYEGREHAVHDLMQGRYEELLDWAQQQAWMVLDPQHYYGSIKALIELKSLKLANRQKQLREEIVYGVDQYTSNLAATSRVAIHRYKKPRSIRDARMVEKIERQQHEDQLQQQQESRAQYFHALQQRALNIKEHKDIQQRRHISLGQAVLQYHHYAKREQLKRSGQITRERMRALRNGDEDTYIELIDKTKDTRLAQILEHTDAFLKSLATAVLDQQARQGFSYANYLARDHCGAGGGSSMDDHDYFKVAHGIQEDVSQPSSLVGGELKKYQLKGLQWMVSLYNNRLNGILADEMGLGKTIQTIALITHLIESKRVNGPYLIILPVSTMTNWAMEFEKWAPSVKTIIYKGPPDERKKLQNDIRRGDFHVLLTSYEYIMNSKDRLLLSKVQWLYMIVDEGHRMKNTNSKLTTTLRRHYHSQYRLILSGTPLQNNLGELWSLLNFILPSVFKSVQSFEEWFSAPFNVQGVNVKIDLNEEEKLLVIKRLHKVLRPFVLRRLKQDVELELPSKVERVVKCRMSALQIKLTQHIQKSGLRLAIPSSDPAAKGKFKHWSNALQQLRKICNHPFVFREVENVINPSHESNELLYRVSGKVELLDRILQKLQATHHKVLIFFQMPQIMNIIEDYMHYRGFPYLRLDGNTKSDDRAQLLQAFNAPDSTYFAFLLSTRAGGLGINLQAADTVILFDSDWNPQQDLQAQDRAHRIGQTREVLILRLITANSIEEEIVARANHKLDIDGKVIQAGKFDHRSTEEDREAFLRSLLEHKEDDIVGNHDYTDNDELNAILTRSEQDLAIFEQIDAQREQQENEYYRRRGLRGTRKPHRLMQEDELPGDFLNTVSIIQDNAMSPTQPQPPAIEYRRNQRRQLLNEIQHDEGLTEEEWFKKLEAIKNAEMEDEERASTKHSSAKKKGKRRRSSSEVSLPEAKSRKRDVIDFSDKAIAERKRKRELQEEFALQGSDSLPAVVRQEMTHIFDICYQAVEDATEIEEDDETILYRKRSDLFMDLVDEKEYPAYYATIRNPIALNIIKRRIHSPYYKSVADFRHDFHVMFDNARIFNEEDSVVYQDANEMQKIFDGLLAQLCPHDMLPSTMAACGRTMYNAPTRYYSPPQHQQEANIVPQQEVYPDESYEDDDDDDKDEDYYE